MKKFIALAAFALVVGGANAGVAGSKGQAPVAQKAQAPAAKGQAAQAPAQKAQAPAAKAQAPAAKGQAAGKPQSAAKGQAATAPADCGCEKVGVLGGLRDRVGGLRERLRTRLSGN